MELIIYPQLRNTHLLIFLISLFYVVMALTSVNISVTVKLGSDLRQFLLHRVYGTMSSLYVTNVYRLAISTGSLYDNIS
jgi:hypothetical protein